MIFYFSEACAIQLDGMVILTGGYRLYDFTALSRVQSYNIAGAISRMPDLLYERHQHACGYYVHEGQVVRIS